MKFVFLVVAIEITVCDLRPSVLGWISCWRVFSHDCFQYCMCFFSVLVFFSEVSKVFLFHILVKQILDDGDIKMTDDTYDFSAVLT